MLLYPFTDYITQLKPPKISHAVSRDRGCILGEHPRRIWDRSAFLFGWGIRMSVIGTAVLVLAGQSRSSFRHIMTPERAACEIDSRRIFHQLFNRQPCLQETHWIGDMNGVMSVPPE